MLFPTYNLLKGLFILWHVIFEPTNANNFEAQLPDLSVISRMFNIFLKPFLRGWHQRPSVRKSDEYQLEVERIIDRKVKELRDYLQDDVEYTDESDDKITFKGNQETTIVEFVPSKGEKPKANLRNVNDTFKANMKKYKKVRNKINMALNKEKVSEKTKTLVMQTLDELLSKMVETQCHWKGGATDNILSRQLILPRTIINTWKDEWLKFKNKITSLVQLNARAEDNFSTLFLYLSKLNSIINDVSINLEEFAKKYKIKCKVSERNYLKTKSSQESLAPRGTYSEEEKNKLCNHLRVCTTELKYFFFHFYSSLNETAVNAVKVYAEMFTRDVFSDTSNEKYFLVDIILRLADQAHKDVYRIFANHTDYFHLGKMKHKKPSASYFFGYIKNIINNVKEEISKDASEGFRHVNDKIGANIRKDIELNLSVDLGNLERDWISKTCLLFSVCNGNKKTRRLGGSEVEKDSVDNKNKIYVQIEVTIDDEGNVLEQNSNIPGVVSEDRDYHTYNETTTLNYEKYANISVTRTTLKVLK